MSTMELNKILNLIQTNLLKISLDYFSEPNLSRKSALKHTQNTIKCLIKLCNEFNEDKMLMESMLNALTPWLARSFRAGILC